MWKISTILALALLLRLIGINWDMGFHLHPDERMLMIVADRVTFFSNLDPQFFNYGSLPIYILKGAGQLLDLLLQTTQYSRYGQMLFLGRFLSMIADVGTTFMVYKIADSLFKRKEIALGASLFYAIAFFPIQNSHFFIVDTFLTFFISLLFYLAFVYLQRPHTKILVALAMVFSAALTTKFTAVIFAPVILALVLWRSKRKVFHLALFTLLSLLFSFLFMPYAFLDYPKFAADLKLQLSLNSNPYIFPYTLQYVGTLPYLYYLKNIFLWGLGPILSTLSIYGLWITVKQIIQHVKAGGGRKGPPTAWSDKRTLAGMNFRQAPLLLFLVFFIFYFLVVGRSAVKFMRYMLPLYPFFAVLASVGLHELHVRTERGKILGYTTSLLIVLAVLWTGFFMTIFVPQHTRIRATEWIRENVPPGSTIAVEHWDDRLPLIGQEPYAFEELALYNQPDDAAKWDTLSTQLKKSDYIILASNRLYIPLTTLGDCGKYLICYPKTKDYYSMLFSGKNGFEKVAEFNSYPTFRIKDVEFRMPDDTADESFTVYDHPKVMIFKKVKETF